MLRRFALYGFLKNQRYFDPFLILFFLDLGLSFFQIGLLVGLRELARNLLEVPSGGLADVWGRRRTLVLSFASYCVSFVFFGVSSGPVGLGIAMVSYGLGDAFRSGTHKALILGWLEREGRLGDKTRVYGYTRSWSKLGSAVSVILSTILVLGFDSYRLLFWASLVPYVLDLVNVATYPGDLEVPSEQGVTPGRIWLHFWETVRLAWASPRMRRLLAESMGFEGYLKVARDYLQPSLKLFAASVGAALLAGRPDGRALALSVGAVYFVLFVLEASASRRAHGLARWAGGEERAARTLWGILGLVCGLLALSALAGRHEVFVVLLVGLLVVQNLWRPVLVSRFYAVAERQRAATVLSLESQAKSVAAMVLAPVVGLSVDFFRERFPEFSLLPVALFGLAVVALFWRPLRGGEGLSDGHGVPK